MNDIEKKVKKMAETPRNDFDARYEQICDRLVAREPKQKNFGWKRYIAVAATFVVIISAVIASIFLFQPNETRYLMADILIENSDQLEYEENIPNINLNILNLAGQTVDEYKLFKTKNENKVVGAYLQFNGTSNNDLYQVTLELYSAKVTFDTTLYPTYTSSYTLGSRTFMYVNNGMEGPFNKISCYYIGDDFSLVVDYKGITGDVWGLLDLLIKTN